MDQVPHDLDPDLCKTNRRSCNPAGCRPWIEWNVPARGRKLTKAYAPEYRRRRWPEYKPPLARPKPPEEEELPPMGLWWQLLADERKAEQERMRYLRGPGWRQHLLELQAELPVLDARTVRRHRLGLAAVLEDELRSDGYPESANVIRQLLQFNDQLQISMQRYKIKWHVCKLREEEESLEEVAAALMAAEFAKICKPPRIAQQADILYEVAEAVLLRGEPFYWLVEQLLLQLVDVVNGFRQDDGFREARARYAYGYVLAEKIGQEDYAREQLEQSRQITAGKLWKLDRKDRKDSIIDDGGAENEKDEEEGEEVKPGIGKDKDKAKDVTDKDKDKRDSVKGDKRDSTKGDKHVSVKGDKRDSARSDKRDSARSDKRDSARSDKSDSARSDSARSDKRDSARSDSSRGDKRDSARSDKSEGRATHKNVKGSDVPKMDASHEEEGEDRRESVHLEYFLDLRRKAEEEEEEEDWEGKGDVGDEGGDGTAQRKKLPARELGRRRRRQQPAEEDVDSEEEKMGGDVIEAPYETLYLCVLEMLARVLVRLARDVRRENPLEATRLCSIALRRIGEPELAHRRSTLLFELGLSYEMLEDYKMALASFLGYLEQPEDSIDLEGICSAYLEISYCYRSLGDKTMATEYLYKVVDTSMNTVNKELIGVSHRFLGQGLLLMARYSEASDRLEEAMRLFLDLQMVNDSDRVRIIHGITKGYEVMPYMASLLNDCEDDPRGKSFRALLFWKMHHFPFFDLEADDAPRLPDADLYNIILDPRDQDPRPSQRAFGTIVPFQRASAIERRKSVRYNFMEEIIWEKLYEALPPDEEVETMEEKEKKHKEKTKEGMEEEEEEGEFGDEQWRAKDSESIVSGTMAKTKAWQPNMPKRFSLI